MKIGILKIYSTQLEIKEFEDNQDRCLKELQTAVGGYIEIIPFHGVVHNCPDELNNVLIVLDEEGKFKGKPVNIRLLFDDLVGDIVFAGMDGEYIIGLTDIQISLLEKEIKRMKI